MLFQNSPTPFDGIILAVVWRVVQQLDDFAGSIGELHYALEEPGTHPAAFRAIVHFELDVCHHDLLFLGDGLPPVLQAIHDEVTGLEGASKRQMQLPTILFHDSKRNLLLLAAHIVIGGSGVTAGFPTP